jgi:hypothetical protein
MIAALASAPMELWTKARREIFFISLFSPQM